MNSTLKRINPIIVSSRLLILIGIFFISLSVFALIGASIIAGMYGLSLLEVNEILQNLPRSSEQRIIHLSMQGISALGGFVGTSFFYLKWVEKEPFRILEPNPSLGLGPYILGGLLFIVVMPFSSILIEWNAHLDFPSFMAEFEAWANQKEAHLAEMTYFLLRFGSLGELFLAILVIGVLPGVGEELLFRGLLQRNLGAVVNIHGAILLSALVFSAIHLQFYGFFPRLFLGLLLGYIYYWSGSLKLAILGHTVNNVFTIAMSYLNQKSWISFDIMAPKSMSIYLVIPSILASAGILLYFWTYYQKQRIKTA